MSLATTSQRIEWIDWMKLIGIYFIVLGHFFSIGDKYIYVFNVPLFFIISGFLSKTETLNKVFWEKMWYNLIVPMLIISVSNFLYASAISFKVGSFEFKNVGYFVIQTLLGFHSGVGTCWFVYTLILLKSIFQYCPKRILFYLGVIPALIAAYVYNHFEYYHFCNYLKASNSIVNVCTAFPFYAIGVYLRDQKDYLNSLNSKVWLSLCFLIGILVVFVCSHFNNYVWMYICGYGGNFFWFLIGGIAGSCCVFVISKLLGHTPIATIIVSKGTILILGFHMYLIQFFRKFYYVSIADFAFAALIIVFFVPIIMVAEKYFPLLLGKYRICRG